MVLGVPAPAHETPAAIELLVDLSLHQRVAETLVPVGSTVIITATAINVVAGIAGVIGTTGTGSTGASSAGAGSSSTGSSNMGTVLGVGAVAATGVAAALYIPDLLEQAESCGSIDVQHIANGEVIQVPQGTRCDLFMSAGSLDGNWSEADANANLANFVYEITVNNVPIQPKGPKELRKDEDGINWHVTQWFETGTLQKGVHSVRAIYRTSITIVKGFTLQAD